VKTWSALSLAHELHRLVLAAYDQMIGLEPDDLSADGCHIKAPFKVTGPGGPRLHVADQRKREYGRS
jgi:hypothetical protein